MNTLEELKQQQIRFQRELKEVRGLDHEPEIWECLRSVEKQIAELLNDDFIEAGCYFVRDDRGNVIKAGGYLLLDDDWYL